MSALGHAPSKTIEIVTLHFRLQSGRTAGPLGAVR